MAHSAVCNPKILFRKKKNIYIYIYIYIYNIYIGFNL